MTGKVLFYLGAAFYGASALLFLAGWLGKRPWGRRWAWAPLLAAAITHVGAMAFQWTDCNCPFSTLQEAVAFYAWALAVLYLLVEWRFGSTVVGVFVIPLGFLAMPASWLLPMARAPLLPLLETPSIGGHIAIFFAAYAAFTLAFAAALAYLLQDRALRKKQLAWDLPPLSLMDQSSRWLVIAGLALMVAALVSGGLTSLRTEGFLWTWQPEQIMSLVTTGLYALYFLVRFGALGSARRAAWFVVICFALVLVTFAGASIVMSLSLHELG